MTSLTFQQRLVDLYSSVPPTAWNAAVGYVIGAVVGILVALFLVMLPRARQALWPVLTFVFVTPLVVIAPLLGTVFGAAGGSLILVSVSIYYTVATLILASTDSLSPRILQVLRVSGGSRYDLLLRVWVPASLPGLFAALRAGVPAALLAAVIGDMFGGTAGLGRRLVSLMQTADTAGILAFCVLCAALAWMGTVVVAGAEMLLPLRLRATWSPAKTVQAFSRQRAAQVGNYRSRLGTLLIALCLWEIAAYWIDVPAYFKGPFSLLSFAASRPGEYWLQLIQSSGWTAARGLVGVSAAVVLAIVSAFLTFLLPRLRLLILTPVYITQTVPLVAIVPLIVGIAGRDSLAVVGVTFVATYFLMFSSVEAGLKATPTSYRLLTQCYGAGLVRHFWQVTLPNSRPYVVAGLALTLPRMMAGAILAEYLLSADGIGGLLYRARAYDFGTVWILALVSGVVGMQLASHASRLAEWLWTRASVTPTSASVSSASPASV